MIQLVIRAEACKKERGRATTVGGPRELRGDLPVAKDNR